MKHFFFLSVRLVLVCCLSLAALQTAQASHAQAGQLTYSYVGTTQFPNRYRVQMDFFRDCSGITPGNLTINCRANTCNGTLVTGMLAQVGQIVTGAPYCPSVQATVRCDGTVGQLTNYQIYSYQCTVDLPPAAEWIISFEESARPTVANVTAGIIRLEATLNNLITPVGGGANQTITNNSPIFSNINLPEAFVYVNSLSTLSFSATDEVDRTRLGRADSLVYALDRPLNGCGTYETYLPYVGTTNPCAPFTVSTSPACQGYCTTSPTSFGPLLPLPVSNDTVGNCPIRIVQPYFRFNSQTGSFSFRPNYYNPNVATAANAGNKYVVTCKVTEFRKINGTYYKVGSVRRDFLIIIVQGVGNIQPPNVPTATVGPPSSGTTLVLNRDTTDLVVRTCNYSRVSLAFTSPNNTPAAPNNTVLTVFADADLNPILLQGGDIGSLQISNNNTPTPKATFYFQPPASAAGTSFVTTLRIEDNSCPIKAVQYRTLRIRVASGSSARVAIAGQNTSTTSLCLGSALTLQGRVNRPDSVRVVAANVTVPQTYSYQWTASGNNGLPAVTNTASITVNPTVTTRYRLTINPTIGFGSTGTCGDTTSVLVRVLPTPATPVITRTGNVLTSSAATGNQWYLNGQPIAGATGATFTATTSGTYTLVVTSTSGGTSCASTASAPLTVLATQHALPGTSLNVAPNPTPDGLLNVVITGYHQPTYLTLLDALGRPVRQVTILTPNPAGTTQRLDLSALASGLYVLQVRTAGGIDTRRVVRE